jgi:hypothetical protein
LFRFGCANIQAYPTQTSSSHKKLYEIFVSIALRSLRFDFQVNKNAYTRIMTRLFVLFALILCSVLPLQAQIWPTATIAPLPQQARESSGLTFFNGRLITHNDSGNPPLLFEIDTLTAAILRSVSLPSNVDWEDITSDNNHLYVGDFGNNLGNRTNLVVYRISEAQYMDSGNSIGQPDAIQFTYPEQTTFPGAPFQTAFDAEALFAYGQHLYIITKNWTASQSYLYQLPKNPGQYAATIRDTLVTPGLVTGADADSLNNVLYITLNTPTTAKLMVVTNLQQWLAGAAPITQLYDLNTTGSIQVEAVVVKNGKTFFSSETGNFGQGFLFAATSGLQVHSEHNIQTAPYPNPSKGAFSIAQSRCTKWHFTDALGRNIPATRTVQNEVAHFTFIAGPGVYYLTLETEWGTQTFPIINQ